MRAPNGYGTVYKLSGKRRRPWVVRVTVGYKPNDNGGLSPIVHYIGYYATQKEAYQARDEYNKRKDPGYIPTFIELADLFEEEHFPTIKEQTQRSYRAARGKCSTIAFKAVSDITYTDLQEVVNAAKASTQAILRVYLNLVFKEALRREYIDRNPAELLKVAKTEKSTIHYRFTSDEIRKLWTVADTPAGAFVLLMIYSGMMPEELRNVTKTMIDLKAQTITGAGAKTEKRKDTPIVFPEFICPVIESLVTEDDRLFPYGKEQMYRLYRNCLERIGIDYKPPYSCRHTTATALVEAEASPELIKEVMRHAKLETTQRYIHPSTGATIATIEKLRKPANF